MDSNQLCLNLIKWLNTLEIGASVSSAEDISSGVLVAEALHQIEPVWFDAGWLGKIKTDVGDNWRLKVSNLKKVTQAINDYFSDSLELNIGHVVQPDVTRLGEQADVEEAGRLLQLVLGVAVNCSRKEEYIAAIQSLEPSVQTALMTAIQELLVSQPLGGSTGGGEAAAADMEQMQEEREKVQQRCYELDNQILLLQDEKVALLAENQQLQRKLKELQNASETVPAADTAGPEQTQRYKVMREKLTAADDEIYKLESMKEELRVRCELVEKELRETRLRNEELQPLADEVKVLRDELDILKERCSRLEQCESTLETYKKRLQEMGDLRRQIRLLEDKNTDYMQQNMELEEEVKKSVSYRPQLDLYKKQVSELHQQLAEETRKRDKAEFDLRKLTEKMTALQSEKERLTGERDQLRERNEELLAQLALTSTPPPPPGSVDRPSSQLTDLDTLQPSDIKEKLIRLQRENRQLRAQVPGDPYRELLDDLKQREAGLQAENRRLNQRILELQSQLEEQPGAPPPGQRTVSGNSRLYSLEQELQNKTMHIGEMEIRLAEQASRSQELQEQLAGRDAQMAAMEERYKKYLEKAKAVIRTLDPKHAASTGGSAESTLLKHQLAEKERLIELMEKESEKARSTREAEEKLMSTAFYNFGIQMHRQAMESRLSNISSGQTSLLARQRQANTRRLHGNSEFYDY